MVPPICGSHTEVRYPLARTCQVMVHIRMYGTSLQDLPTCGSQTDVRYQLAILGFTYRCSVPTSTDLPTCGSHTDVRYQLAILGFTYRCTVPTSTNLPTCGSHTDVRYQPARTCQLVVHIQMYGTNKWSSAPLSVFLHFCLNTFFHENIYILRSKLYLCA